MTSGPGVVVFVVIAMAIIATQEAVVKLLSDDVSIWQLHIVRSVLIVGMAVAAGRVIRDLEMTRLKHPLWALLRTAFFSAAFFLLYTGLPFLSLAQSGSVFFTGPLFITLFAALLLGEGIGPRRIAALILGFSGVLVTAQPWREAVDSAILFPLAAAACYALGVIVTRSKCREESALSLQVLHHTTFGVLSVVGLGLVISLPIAPETRAAWPFLLGTWTAMGLAVGLLMLVNALTNFVGALMLTLAYQRNEASGIAPLEYSYLAFAPILDLLIWQKAPDIATFAGIALVAGAGIFIAMRERAQAR